MRYNAPPVNALTTINTHKYMLRFPKTIVELMTQTSEYVFLVNKESGRCIAGVSDPEKIEFIVWEDDKCNNMLLRTTSEEEAVAMLQTD